MTDFNSYSDIHKFCFYSDRDRIDSVRKKALFQRAKMKSDIGIVTMY